MYKLAFQHKILFNWLGNNHQCIVIVHFNTALEIKRIRKLSCENAKKKNLAFSNVSIKNNTDLVEMSQLIL